MVLWMDSFDDRSSTYQNRYDASANTAAIAQKSPFRTGNGIKLGVTGGNMAQLDKQYSARATFIQGAAIQTDNLASITKKKFFAILDSATEQVALFLNTDGTLVAKNGSGATLGTSVTALTINTTYYVEWKGTIHGSAGAVEVKINGTVALSLSGINTQNSGSAQWTVGRIVGPNDFTGNCYFDDYYLSDQSNSAPGNDYLNCPQIQCLKPTGAGTTTQWTPLSGSNYANVNEASPDDDTSYNADGTLSEKDTYALADLSGLGNVQAVALNHRSKVDTAGARKVSTLIRSAGTDYAASGDLLTTGYVNYQRILEQDPATSANWTVSAVNAAEIGVKVTS